VLDGGLVVDGGGVVVVVVSTGGGAVVVSGGCFWCVEAVYAQVEGVLGLTSGYAGGSAETADYETVCTGRTGHAEAVKIRFDPSKLSYGQVLKLFLSVSHDPGSPEGIAGFMNSAARQVERPED